MPHVLFDQEQLLFGQFPIERRFRNRHPRNNHPLGHALGDTHVQNKGLAKAGGRNLGIKGILVPVQCEESLEFLGILDDLRDFLKIRLFLVLLLRLLLF